MSEIMNSNDTMATPEESNWVPIDEWIPSCACGWVGAPELDKEEAVKKTARHVIDSHLSIVSSTSATDETNTRRYLTAYVREKFDDVRKCRICGGVFPPKLVLECRLTGTLGDDVVEPHDLDICVSCYENLSKGAEE